MLVCVYLEKKGLKTLVKSICQDDIVNFINKTKGGKCLSPPLILNKDFL